MHGFFEELRKRGWAFSESDQTLDLLPETVRARYPRVPKAVADFLGRLAVCHNAADNAWMLTPAEFRKTDAEGFRWNEYELMALEGAEDDPAEQSAIRAFWDDHLPIMMAVHSDYDYIAVRVAEPHFGSIVHGYAPEWDTPSVIARSFEEFLVRFTQEAASRQPAYPYDVFL